MSAMQSDAYSPDQCQTSAGERGGLSFGGKWAVGGVTVSTTTDLGHTSLSASHLSLSASVFPVFLWLRCLLGFLPATGALFYSAATVSHNIPGPTVFHN